MHTGQRHIHAHRYTSSLEERFPSSPTRPLTFTLLPIPIFPLSFHFPCSPAAPSLPCSISPSSRTSASSSIGNFYHAYTPVLLYRSSLFASLTSRSYHIVLSTSSPIPLLSSTLFLDRWNYRSSNAAGGSFIQKWFINKVEYRESRYPR